MPRTSRRSQRLLASQGGSTYEHQPQHDFGGTTVGAARRKHPPFPQAPSIDTMQSTYQPGARNGGQLLARIAAVLLALGVLGYLMWRSQTRHGTAPKVSQGAAPSVGDPDFDNPDIFEFAVPLQLDDLQVDDRANKLALPPMLNSSKELIIEPDSRLPKPRAPEGQSPTGSPAETTPAPETPR